MLRMPRFHSYLAATSLLFFIAISCNSLEIRAEEAGQPAAEPVYVQLVTTEGVIVLQLDSEKAPISTANFLKYVESKHYEGTVFHRVIQDFMIQGGGYAKGDMENEKKTLEPIKNEAANGLRNLKYTIAMARTGNPNSATAQFFINTVNNKALDREFCQDGYGYAVFGRVVQGMETVDKIAMGAVKRGGEGSVPVEPVVIEKAQVVVPAP